MLDRCERDFRQMARAMRQRKLSRVLGEDDIPGVFGRKREFIPIALASSPATTIVKMSVLPTRMQELLADATRKLRKRIRSAVGRDGARRRRDLFRAAAE